MTVAPAHHRRPAHPFRALAAYDLARLGAWVRLGAKDPIGLAFALILIAAAGGGLVFAGLRVAPTAARDPLYAAMLGAGTALIGGIVQASFGRSLEGGPMEPATLHRPGLAAWTALRAALAAAPALVALVAAGGSPIALAAFAATLALVAFLPRPALASLAGADAREHPSRLIPRLGLWALVLLPVAGPRGALSLAAAVAAGGFAVRLGLRNSGEAFAGGLALAAAVLCGLVLRALDPDLLSALAVTRQSLARLLALFAAGPSAAALLGGLVAALAGGLSLPAAAAAALTGAVASAIWVIGDALNLLSYGPTGLVRTWIYAGLLAVLFQAIGPLGLPAVAAGLYFMARTAARRRWSAL